MYITKIICVIKKYLNLVIDSIYSVPASHTYGNKLSQDLLTRKLSLRPAHLKSLSVEFSHERKDEYSLNGAPSVWYPHTLAGYI